MVEYIFFIAMGRRMLLGWFIAEMIFYILVVAFVLRVSFLGPSFIINVFGGRDFLGILLTILSALIGGLMLRGR